MEMKVKTFHSTTNPSGCILLRTTTCWSSCYPHALRPGATSDQGCNLLNSGIGLLPVRFAARRQRFPVWFASSAQNTSTLFGGALSLSLVCPRFGTVPVHMKTHSLVLVAPPLPLLNLVRRQQLPQLLPPTETSVASYISPSASSSALLSECVPSPGPWYDNAMTLVLAASIDSEHTLAPSYTPKHATLYTHLAARHSFCSCTKPHHFQRRPSLVHKPAITRGTPYGCVFAVRSMLPVCSHHLLEARLALPATIVAETVTGLARHRGRVRWSRECGPACGDTVSQG